MIRELYFPTPIYILDINDKSINDQLEKDILNWYYKDKGITRTNINGWHSKTTMHEMPEYKRLTNALYEAQKKIYIEEDYDSEPFLGNMWANVYYVKANKDSGHLKIDDPRSIALMSRPRLKEKQHPMRLWRESSFEPKAGRLIMFPAWLVHCVDPNMSDELRISVSFNFMQKCMVV